MSQPGQEEMAELIARYKAEGRQKEIADALAALKAKKQDCGPKDLAYLTGDAMADYLHDMGIVQRFADKNRMTIAEAILKGLGLGWGRFFTTTHNYIDLEEKILRKDPLARQIQLNTAGNLTRKLDYILVGALLGTSAQRPDTVQRKSFHILYLPYY